MEQRQLNSESKNEEYQKQAPFEYSINRLLDVVDIRIAQQLPIFPVIDSIYNKVSVIIKDKEIHDVYNKINENKNKIEKEAFEYYYVRHSNRISMFDRIEGWKHWSDGKIERTAKYQANSFINKECKKLVQLIIKDLKGQGLILLTKKELESRYE